MPEHPGTERRFYFFFRYLRKALYPNQIITAIKIKRIRLISWTNSSIDIYTPPFFFNMLKCAENQILQFHQNQGNDKGRQKWVYSFGGEFFVQNAGASCHNQRTYQYAQYLFPSKHRKTSFVLCYIYCNKMDAGRKARLGIFRILKK